MNTIFIGGSREISRPPLEVEERLNNIISSGHQVIVGDANGADKAVQKHLSDRGYRNVTRLLFRRPAAQQCRRVENPYGRHGEDYRGLPFPRH